MIRIPRSAPGRRDRTYAQLILRIPPHPCVPFEGRFFRCGSTVEDGDLHPTPDYPATPLLVEFAGSDRTGRGHNRSNDVHVLWRYRDGHWIELARTLSQGPEWVFHMRPIVERELVAAPIDYAEIAGRVSNRVLELLDQELNELAGEGRARVMSFLWDQFTARLVA